MPIQQYTNQRNYPNAGPAGTPYASSNTLTDVNYATTTNCVLAAHELTVGSTLEMVAYGVASNTGTPTLLLGFYYGGVAGTALAASSAITTTTAMTNWYWRIEYTGTVRTLGTSGTIMGAGKLFLPTSLTAWTIRPIPETALAAVTIDTTVTKALTVGAQWSANSSSNTLTCHHFSVRAVP